MDTKNHPTAETHSETCPHPGFRYGTRIRRTPASVAAGTVGKVVMFCKTSGCPARRTV